MKAKKMEDLSKIGELGLPVSRAGGLSKDQSGTLGADRLSEELLFELLEDKESIINGISDAIIKIDLTVSVRSKNRFLLVNSIDLPDTN